MLTGCASNSALSGRGKKKGLNVLHASKEHQSSLGQLGEEAEPCKHTSEACEDCLCIARSQNVAEQTVPAEPTVCYVQKLVRAWPEKIARTHAARVKSPTMKTLTDVAPVFN